VTLFGKAPRPPQRIALYDNNRHVDCWLLCWLGAAGIALDAAPNFHALPNPELAGVDVFGWSVYADDAAGNGDGWGDCRQ
jgi:hypothetical protein